MHAPLILTSLLNLLVLTPLAMSANSAPALFDSSPKGQGEWKRFCSPSSATSATELPPFACFTIYDDITTSAHSGTHQKLGYASASGQGKFLLYRPFAAIVIETDILCFLSRLCRGVSKEGRG